MKLGLNTKYSHPNHTGDVTSVGDGATTIANDAVTYAKMQNISATDRILGRDTDGAGDTEELIPAAVREMLFEDYTTLTYEASITPDADTVSRFDLQLTGNATINKPSNLTAGQKIEYRIEQDTGGTNEITWSADYRSGELPTTQVAQGGNEITYVLCLYHEDDDKMDIVAFMRGY